MTLRFRWHWNGALTILEYRGGEEQLTEQVISWSLGKLGCFTGPPAKRSSDSGHRALSSFTSKSILETSTRP